MGEKSGNGVIIRLKLYSGMANCERPFVKGNYFKRKSHYHFDNLPKNTRKLLMLIDGGEKEMIAQGFSGGLPLLGTRMLELSEYQRFNVS
jgi:hypothetical protein